MSKSGIDQLTSLTSNGASPTRASPTGEHELAEEAGRYTNIFDPLEHALLLLLLTFIS
jgi:hypothetical protein